MVMVLRHMGTIARVSGSLKMSVKTFSACLKHMPLDSVWASSFMCLHLAQYRLYSRGVESEGLAI